MATVTSKDGTTIGYSVQGQGPALVLVDGAMCYRGFGPMPQLANLLAPHFKVYTYDRRGRGESNNSKPFSVDREIEDIEALIEAAGGSVYLYGISSGAALALQAAAKLGSKIKKLALYEPPYNSMPGAAQQWQDYRKKLKEAYSSGRNGDAVVAFMELVGTPADMVAGMRQSPAWPMMEAIAPTLEYDAAALGDSRTLPVDQAAKIKIPVLVMDGGANLQMMPFMHQSASAIAKAAPNARQRTLEGQTHDVNFEVLAPVLIEFFTS